MSDLKELMKKYVPATYTNQGFDSIASHEHLFEILLQHGKLPAHSWPEASIEYALSKLSLMDSNNFPSNIGVGEREGRIFSSLVARRHYHLSHGIGRSGDIIEVQPKAAGSSLLYKLTNLMAKHALTLAGIVSEINCIVFPLATGMTLAMSMMTLKSTSNNPAKRYVIWPRIDQKSCFKSIIAAGLEPIIVENIIDPTTGSSMNTNLVEIENILQSRSHEVLCVLSTTSCFAPRQPDLVDEIAKLCKQYEVGHVVNNAYGLQCARITKLLTRATRVGRVDASKSMYTLSLI
ncbi:O-phosphoseryl-tRNA(Sec) selenium transferase [archaeon]|nr:MAG: O-phosphoseryl-tRNA(Sec) selenium transferase [archaeon]